MYEPGKVLKCCTRDTDVDTIAIATTKWIDAGATSPSWQSSGDMSVGRVNMNLTLVPTGEVLVTGGTGYKNDEINRYPRKRPELWKSSDNAWHVVSGSDTLASSTVARGYHSTAILLPDGRILCAGGNGQDIGNDLYQGDMYCPPYLFKSDGGLAVRPINSNTPLNLCWGEKFRINVPSTANITRACLIRPAATTHAFDMNQRYVPLPNPIFASNPPRLIVTAPASPDSAPPGYYMLFLTGSADGADVPSIARWVKLGVAASCDTVAPDTVTNFAVDAISSSSVYLTWTASAEDGHSSSSGAAMESDLRGSTSQINPGSWDAGLQSTDETTPNPPGYDEVASVGSLHSNTTYHFGLWIHDHNNNVSNLNLADVKAKTLSSGGGGGNSASEISAGTTVGSRGPGSRSNQATGTPLIVETSRSASGAWQVSIRALSGAADLPADVSTGMLVQTRDAAGSWITRSHFVPDASENTLGLSALRAGGRAVCLGSWSVQQIAASLPAATGDYTLTGATQSGLGDLGADFIAAGGAVSLVAGDTLNLSYSPSSTPIDSPSDWFALITRTTPGGFAARIHAPPAVAVVPKVFALRQNQPNPFSMTTSIHFDLPVGAIVRLDVFDATGARVRTLANRYFQPGYHAVDWDHTREAGARVGPGVYFYRLEAGPFRDRKKMVLMP